MNWVAAASSETPSPSPSPEPAADLTGLLGANALKLEFGPDLWWQVLLFLLAIFITSGLATALVNQFFPRRYAKKDLARRAGLGVLDATNALRAELLAYPTDGSATAKTDKRLGKVRTELYVSAAKSGNQDLLAAAKVYVKIAERYAAGDVTVNADAEEGAFLAFITKVTSYVAKQAK